MQLILLDDPLIWGLMKNLDYSYQNLFFKIVWEIIPIM